VVLAIPGLPWLHFRSERLAVEHRAAAIAGALTNRTIAVHCPGPVRRHLFYEINEGSVMFDADGVPTDATNLSADTCDGLRTVIDRGAGLDLTCLTTTYDCTKDERRAAQALAVFTHETMHLRGTMDEGTTECQARKRVADVAQRFGVTPASAAAVAQWQATDWREMLPDRYRDGSC
jgi:hypothetical protein